jgi:hypothetical protein
MREELKARVFLQLTKKNRLTSLGAVKVKLKYVTPTVVHFKILSTFTHFDSKSNIKGGYADPN